MADLWFYTSEGKQMEPVSGAELKQLAAAGLLKPTDMVWQEGMPKWVRASSTPSLFGSDGFTARGTSSAPAPAKKTSPKAARAEESEELDETPKPKRRRDPDWDDHDDDEAEERRRRRRHAQSGLPTEAKVGLILAGVVLLIALVVGGLFLLTRGGDNKPAAGPFAGGGDNKGGARPGVLMSYTVDLQVEGQDIRPVQLKAGNRYEFSVKAKNQAGDVDLYIVNNLGQDLAMDEAMTADAFIDFTATYTGMYKIDVFNVGPMVNQATITVTDKGPSLNPAKQIINRPPTKKLFNPPIPKPPVVPNPRVVPNPEIGGGAPVLNVAGNLSPLDPRDKVLQNPCKTYNVMMAAGTTYDIRLNSNQFDSFLRLENPQGQQVAFDDDSGGFPNARIVYNCPTAGTYRIVATCLDRKTGQFTLTVQEK